jgi:hypothetical protein
MKLPWAIKLRIMAVMAVGAAALGLLCWPLAAPDDPLAPASLLVGGFGWPIAAILAAAVATGLAGYLAAWPYGKHMGGLAVPTGLAVWAVRSGSVAALLQQQAAAQRHATFAAFRWEPLLWLAIVAAGYAPSYLAERIRGAGESGPEKCVCTAKKLFNTAVALLGSAAAAQLGLTLLAQDVRLADSSIGWVVGQPVVGQIAFAVLATFGLVGYAAKKLLDAGYAWPVISTALVPFLAAGLQGEAHVIQTLIERWPAVFFPGPVPAIAPVQLVAFGTLGSIAGYWLAIRHQESPRKTA